MEHYPSFFRWPDPVTPTGLKAGVVDGNPGGDDEVVEGEPVRREVSVELDPPEDDETPTSRALCMLLLDDENDRLRKLSLTDLKGIFLSEFDKAGLRAFGMNCIIGYIETGRITSPLKVLASFGLLGSLFGKSTENILKESHTITSLIYTALKYECNGPVRCMDSRVYADDELYALSKLILADAWSNVWVEPMGVAIQRWGREIESMRYFGTFIRDAIQKEIHNVLNQIEVTLYNSLEWRDLVLVSKELRETLLAVLDKFALQRYDLRLQMLEARQEIVMNASMGELFPEWKHYSKFAEDPVRCIENELVLASPLPSPQFSQAELRWMYSGKRSQDESESQLEETNQVDATDDQSHGRMNEAEVEVLVQQAFQEALTIVQRKQLVDEIRECSDVSRFRELNPSSLHQLVEYNPEVAIEMLLKILEQDLNAQEYLTALVNMDMSVHSMEVVNRLTSSVSLPKDFLYWYISNCIKTCDKMQDKYMQNRLARLLCVFLQALIRNQIIDIQDIYVEVEPFLLTFSRIREAAALFRLIRHADSEEVDLNNLSLSSSTDMPPPPPPTRQQPFSSRDPKL